MRMIPESEKYSKVLNLLRKSVPLPDSSEDIGREVIKRLSTQTGHHMDLYHMIDFLFGWVYIGWVRRSLIAASIGLIAVFVYQQGVILKQINYLSRQTISTERQNSFISTDLVEQKLMLYKLTGRRFASKNITVSEEQMEQLIKSVNDLQVKYKDLVNLIEENPELKKYFENKINEKSHEKTKL